MSLIVMHLLMATIFAQLPRHILSYLDQNFPTSTLPTHSQFSDYLTHFAPNGAIIDPWYVIADFSGDGSTDIAVMIIDSMKTKYIGINSDDGRLNHYELFPPHEINNIDTLYTCIRLKEPGTITQTMAGPDDTAPQVIDMVHPGIEVVFYEQARICVYWSENRYEKLWTSD
ncbi:MAG: hypothetical protein HON27_00305 [Candidatus Marinimicrobia bacterium]|nr:hypothetical protein [Candidatus Neomarinimicrobiota bacterium]